LLSGSEAEQFVRFRSGYATGDLGRLDAQKLFFAALFKTVTEELTLGEAISAAKESIGRVETDLSFGAISRIVTDFCRRGENITVSYMTLPGEAVKLDGINGSRWYYVVNRSASNELFRRCFFEGDPDAFFEFDRERRFCAIDNETVCNIYFDENFDFRIYSEEDLNKTIPSRAG